MVLDLPVKYKSIFKHSDDTETGLGRERIGQATIIVSLDGSGDSDNIQDAINQLPSTGGVVFIKEGTYDLWNTINITSSNITLEGIGSGTEIKAMRDIDLLIASGTIEGIKISNIRFIGDSGGDEIINNGLRFTNVSESIIENCWIENNSLNAMVLTNCSEIIISDCIINTSDRGILLVTSNDKMNISGNIISNNSIIGITGTLDNSSIVNNVCDSNTSSGILIDTGDDNVISGNVCSNSTNFDGIQLTSSDNNVVSGNVCKSNGRYGINVANAASDKNIITGNIALLNTTGAINDAGTNTHPNGASGTNNLALDDLNIIA